nr:NAD-dependent epimerase/dehydratase family protein [Arthrobacter sp. AFG7.2]
MDKAGVRRLVFSSSATVYGTNDNVPLIEKSVLDAINPYGRTKEQLEDIFSDLSGALIHGGE